VNDEYRLRKFLKRADGSPPPSAPDWSSVAARGRRSLRIRRIVLAVATLTAVAGSALIAARITGDVRPPADRPGPYPSPSPGEVNRRCPEAGVVSPGPLGVVVFRSDEDLRVVDVAAAEERVLARAIPFEETTNPVRVSPDGRWVSFGPGRFVPVAGGEVCAPFGRRLSEVAWLPEGNFVATTRRGGFVRGNVRGVVSELLPAGWGASGYALDPGTGVAAVTRLVRAGDGRVREVGLYLVDTATGESSELVDIPPRRAVEPRVAAWVGAGTRILYWNAPALAASLAADGAPLMVVDTTTGGTSRVADGMLMSDAQIASCRDGDATVVSVGGGREITYGKELAAVRPPSYLAVPLRSAPPGNAFWPDCFDGYVAATVTKDQPERRFGTAPRRIEIFPLDPASPAPPAAIDHGDGAAYEFARFSRRHRGEDQVLLYVRRVRRPTGPAQLWISLPGGRRRALADLGRVGSYYGDYGYDGRLFWYQP
jgi:hypothetical protein